MLALTALLLLLGLALGIFALELARRLRALWLRAFPVAVERLANCLTDGFLGDTDSCAGWLMVALDTALRAVIRGATILRADHLALRFFAFDITSWLFWSLAHRSAARLLADRFALGWALRTIALPGALWVTHGKVGLGLLQGEIGAG